MPNDVPDYTSAVQVTAGSISITGTPTVLVSGTVAVSITGANQVILGAGTNSIGSISAIGSTVTVAGTVIIGNTPAVTISGTPTVNIATGTVSIAGTPNITIAGQSITVNTNQPQSLVLDTDIGPNLTSVSDFTSVLPTGTHAVEVYWSAGTVALSRIDSWSLQGGATSNYYRNFTTSPDGLPYPVKVSGLIENNGLKVNAHFTPPLGAGETVHVKVVALLDDIVPTITGQDAYAHVDPLRTRRPAYDALAFSDPGTGIAAQVTLSAVAGRRWIAALAHASFTNNSAATIGASLLLTNGVTNVLIEVLSAPSALVDRLNLTDLAIPAPVGNSMGWAFAAGVANVLERVTLGAYQE